MAHHKLDLADMNQGIIELLCPICGRHLKFSDHNLEILDRGDQSASHSFSMGGISINSVEAKEDDGLTDEWREWLEEIL